MIKIGLTDFTPADKTIEIRNNKEVIKAKYAISATDILKCTLMNEHYIEISFQYNRYIAFKRSDYILWNGSKYTLREDYIPEQVNKRKYDYTLRFEAVEMLFQDIQYYYLNQSLKESEWRLAGNPEYFIKIAVDNANRYFKVTDFQIGVIEPTEVKDIIFDTNTNTFDALTQIAETYESEWYMTGKTINLVKKVSFGAEVDFETEVSILSMSRSEGENSKKYTRILALGSERNLPKDYRGSSTGEGVDAVYPKRLRIPVSKGDVIDAYPNMSPDEVVEGTVIFDEVYPKRVGTIQAVGTIEYTDTDEDTGEVTKWNAFKIKDSGINFKEEYLLPGVELRLSMQSGDLNEFDFALKFHKDGFSSSDNSQYFEIVRSEDYGKKLPNDTMKPKAGDKYVLYGFNIALVSDQYVPAGELELFETASAWIKKQLQDTSVYDCPTVIDHFKKNEMDLEIGQKIKLIKDTGSNRNVLPNTNQGISGWGSFLQNGTVTRSEVEELGVRACKLTTTVASTGYHVLYHTINRPLIKNNTQYTLSVDVFCEFATTATFRLIALNAVNSLAYFGSKAIPANTWTRVELTATTNSDTGTNQYLYITDFNKLGSVTFANLKLEEGNKATAWTPAPEDIDGMIRSSRIMGYEKKLVNKYDATYTVGDNSAYSRLAAIEKDLKELQYAGVVYENTGSGGVYLIKQFDTTTPSDFNAYSAKASDAKYFNKQTGGTIQGDTLFQKNMQVQGSAISDVFQNSTFTAGQFGSGFQIKRDANGQSYMEVDNLMVRRETVFNKLTIAEIKSVGGSILLSLANMVISKVEDKTSAWRCYFDNLDGTVPNDFAVNDQVICRKFTGKDIKYYWSKVTSVGINFIEISKTDKDGSGVPTVADEVIQLGNRSDVNRQYAIMLSAYGSDAPSIKQYAGINSYDLTDKEVTAISPKGNKFTGSFTVSTNGTTAPVYKERQVFVNGTVYYLNDRVSYLGSYWVCIVNSTITTPSETSLSWRKDTAGQTDINNAVNDISIGGRNLVPYTNQGAMWWWRTVQNGTHSITETEALGVRAMKATTTVASTGYNVITKGLRQSLLKNNTQYIVSFDVFCEFGTSAYLSLKEGSAINPLTPDYHFSIKKDTWIHIEQIINTNSVAIANQLIYFAGFNNVGSTIFANLKLEEGNKATAWTPAPEDVQAGIDSAQSTATQAKTDATNAQNAANNAQSSANTANSLLTDIASDNKLTPNEKQETKKEWDTIVSEYPKNTAQATKFGVSSSAYTTAYNALSSYITPLLSNLSTTSDINGATFRATFKAYYDARTDLLNAISVKAKELADAAQTTANNAQKEAEKVRTEYKADFVVLDTKIASKVSQTDFNALGNRVSQTESSITQQAGQITSVVEKVDNIKIGSRNVLPNTNQGISGWGSFLQNGTVTRSEVEELGVRACKLTTTVASTGYHVLYHTINRPLIKNNTQYTLSVDVFCEFATTATFRLIALNAVNSLAYFGSKAIPANTWTRVKLTATTNSDTGTNQYLYITDFNKLGSVTFANLKLEEGNKATAWTPAPEDVQAGIDSAQSSANNAQSTADSKNRTYYQDTVPSVPSGGHKPGDLWYKTSLVDSSGNINSDTSKNIYQLQYRWSSTAWMQVNWSVAKSKIEQTDSSISMIVEKTGVNSVGAGSSLYSLINQTASEIRLEVSSIKVGGRNIIPNTNQGQYGWYRTVQNGTHNITEVGALGVRAMKATTSVVSTGYNVIHKNLNHSLLKNNTQYVISFDVYCDVQMYINFLLQAANGVNALTPWYSKTIVKDTWIHIEQIITTNSTAISNQVLYISGVNYLGSITIANLKLEEGNKATAWTPAPEDVQAGIDSKTTLEEVSSSLTLTDNKISLASKTIELKGTTIAKAIEAEDLKVGSRAGASALEVLKSGTFYAKGSSGTNSSLIIDSGTQSIEIVSPYSASGNPSGGNPGSSSGKSTVSITSQSGGVRVSNDNYDTSIMSTSGIFANNAGQTAYPLGVPSKGAIVGLGFGNMAADPYSDYFIAGVIGRASNSNSNPAPAYGGHFDILKANGLCFACRQISSTTTLYKTDCYVSCYNMSAITVYLPSSPYAGQVIYLRQMNSNGFTINGSGKNIHTDGNDYPSVGNRAGRGDTTMLVYDGKFWCLNYMPR